MLIYTQSSSPRADYIFSVLFSALGIKDFALTINKDFFKNASDAKLNYSSDQVAESQVWIKPVNLLFEPGIKEQQTECFDYNQLKAFFKTCEGDFPFDIFAASFYLISRYEEYLPHAKDMYGRYAHENSLAYKEDFLHLPLVNLWLQEFRKLLLQKFASLTLNPKPFIFLPTYDIDIAYSYLHKGAARNFGGFVNAMWHSKWSLVKERIDVLFKKQKDPFDCYEWLNKLHEAYQLRPLYFFLLANKNKGYDKNIPPAKQAMKELVKQHALQYEVGIHPSWQSGDRPGLLKQEIVTLEKLSNKFVTKSRQHYIRMHLPATYKRLIDAGITEDYSMGYGSINGFRASYCLPYLWYDLKKEQTTNLTIYPFCYMDANSYYEQHYSAAEALKEMNYYHNITKQVNGLFITIWHNHFLGSDKMFTGWKEIYTAFISNLDVSKSF